jgi:bzd-type benzoyl-CoA reductase Q subunit
MPQEFWRWKEYNWHAPDLAWQKGKIVTAGVDVGSVSTQAVVMVDGKLYAYANRRTGSSSPDSARLAMEWALQDTDLPLDKIHYIVGTGYGRVNVPFAHKTLTEIACHARGANFLYGASVRTVLDMGGQDCKAIKIDASGKVVNFLMNDKCAAGTGRGLEVIADLLQVPIEEMGELSLRVEKEPEPVSSTCVVFAKSEALGLLRKGWKKNAVLAAYSRAMAHRVCLLLKRLGVEKEFVVTGGIAKNIGIVARLEKELGVTAIKPNFDTQIAGAVGAALIAKKMIDGKKDER